VGGPLGISISALARNHAGVVEGLSRTYFPTMLSFAGIKLIRESLYGLTFADDKKRTCWIEDLRRHGSRGD
jgi:hypothetical protein